MRTPFEDPVIQSHIEEMQRLLPLPGRRVFRALKKLEKEALAVGDDGLSGFVFFYYALAHYARDEMEPAHTALRTAIRHLMKTDNEELLARSFNLFALEAQRRGCYDISQNYFRMAYALVQKDKSSLVRAIIDANIGNLLTESGEYSAACRRIRRSLPVVRRHTGDVMHGQNLAVTYLNIGLNALYAGEYEEASKTLAVLEGMVGSIDIEESAYLNFLILRALYAFILETKKEALAHTRALAKELKGAPLYSEIVFDLYNYCRLLLRKKAYSIASILIRVIVAKESPGSSAYRRMLLSELTVEHLERQKDRRGIKAALQHQRELSRTMQEEQRQMYRYSVKLMFLISELREEQDAFRRENELLKLRAETDALTGLPNRYALSHALEVALSGAQADGKRLGIGLIDIDAFKQYNDRYGHSQGDQCLKLTADALKKIAKEHGLFIARYGGDEFVLIYDDRPDREIETIAEEIRHLMLIPVSHGFYNAVPDENSLPFVLLAKADAEMYRERRERR